MATTATGRMIGIPSVTTMKTGFGLHGQPAIAGI
jgi:hypothetical protein